jgi:hypothetical protein
MKYKYMTIENVNDEKFNGKLVYRIFNNRTKDQLGILSYYKPWKTYVFSSIEECVFDHLCLRDIIDFLENYIEK